MFFVTTSFATLHVIIEESCMRGVGLRYYAVFGVSVFFCFEHQPYDSVLTAKVLFHVMK